jgi:hypothetical protein
MTDTGNATHASVPLASPCSMREACARAMLDRGGKRCPACPVRELCQSESRWVVKATPPH